jgi:Tol biopolymer transport system component
MHTIWISPLGGGRPVQPENGSDQHGPSWSPDGNQIAYTRQQNGKWALVRTPIGGGTPVVVRDGVFSFATDWSRSSSGDWICYSTAEEGVQLVSPDGKDKKVLSKSDSPVFGFSRDGSTVFILRRGTTRWQVAAVDVRSATERKVSPLEIPFTAEVEGFSLSPDGKSFTTAIGNPTNDIWVMEGFQQPIPWWRALRRDR